MNYTNFDQTGGFPLETETLSKMQEAYDIFQAFGNLVGTKSIVKGCVQTGTNVSDGVIYWDGELLPFVGGGIQSKIIIVEEVTSVEFEDGDLKPTYYKRHATFGTGVGAVLWSLFKRAYPLTSALYIDKVDMYAGDLANIPAGWHLCDGTNGTADLRNRFVVGYNATNPNYDEIGKVGGASEVALSINEIPSHNHAGSVYIPPHSHTYSKSIPGRGYETRSDDNPHGNYTNTQTSSAGGQNASLTTNNRGGGQAHENRPPFYTLAFIQFKGI